MLSACSLPWWFFSSCWEANTTNLRSRQTSWSHMKWFVWKCSAALRVRLTPACCAQLQSISAQDCKLKSAKRVHPSQLSHIGRLQPKRTFQFSVVLVVDKLVWPRPPAEEALLVLLLHVLEQLVVPIQPLLAKPAGLPGEPGEVQQPAVGTECLCTCSWGVRESRCQPGALWCPRCADAAPDRLWCTAPAPR